MNNLVRIKLDSPQKLDAKLNQGEVVIYSPRTLHSENNDKCNKTRFNLEFRINPHKNAL